MGNQKHEKIVNRYLNIWVKIKGLLAKDLNVETIHKINILQLK